MSAEKNDSLSEKALEDRRLILEGLAARFEKKKLSRKNKDGSNAYQNFFDHIEKKKDEVIPVRYINK